MIAARSCSLTAGGADGAAARAGTATAAARAKTNRRWWSDFLTTGSPYEIERSIERLVRDEVKEVSGLGGMEVGCARSRLSPTPGAFPHASIRPRRSSARPRAGGSHG